MIPKDVVIGKLKTECEGTYNSDALLFNFGQSTLKSDSMQNLKSLAKLSSRPPVTLNCQEIRRYYVDRHTCNIGGAGMNCRLSWARSNAVIDHLVKLGVPKEKLVARGYGLSYPAHSNDSEETRMLNRRVVLKGDCRKASSEKDPEPCSMSGKGAANSQKEPRHERVSPTLEEVAGIKRGSKDRKIGGSKSPGFDPGKDNQSLPRGFKRVD